MKTKALLLALILLGFQLPAQQVASYCFAQRGEKQIMMDVYKPQNPRADNTCVVYLFGGGFVQGSRSDSASIRCCKALTDKGFTAVAVDYRLGVTKTKYDSLGLFHANKMFADAIDMAVEDLSAAIAYLWNHAEQLGINRNRIVLTGASAGAITVLQTDYCRANGLGQASALPKDFKPLAVIPYSGAIYCANKALKYATPPAPTCFFHGTIDRIVNYKRFRSSLRESLNGTDRLAKLFAKNSYPYWSFRFKDRGHEVNHYLPYTMIEFCAFLDMIDSGRITFCDAYCQDAALKQSPYAKSTIFDLYRR